MSYKKFVQSLITTLKQKYFQCILRSENTNSHMKIAHIIECNQRPKWYLNSQILQQRRNWKASGNRAWYKNIHLCQNNTKYFFNRKKRLEDKLKIIITLTYQAHKIMIDNVSKVGFDIWEIMRATNFMCFKTQRNMP